MLTSRAARAYSTKRDLRSVANRTGPPCRPRTPSLLSFWQTLSSFRLNLVSVQPSRLAASAEDGAAAAPRTERATLGVPVQANDVRADHLRSVLTAGPGGALVVTPFPRQDSGMLSLLARADALVLRAPHAPALPAGAEVEVIRLDTIGL